MEITCRGKIFLSLALVYCICLFWYSTASAQLWSGILDRSRATDWTRTGVTGGIPHRTNQCGATIAAYTGSAERINDAIRACHQAGGGVVQLAAGTFSLSTTITFITTGPEVVAQNVTLRGAGP